MMPLLLVDLSKIFKIKMKFLQKLYKAGLKLTPQNCCFFTKQVDFLGHVISGEEKRRPKQFKEWQKPESLNEVHLFLSFCSDY